MSHYHLYVTDLLQSLKNNVDTIWLISLTDKCIEIVQDSITPEWENCVLDYETVSQTYQHDFIYPPDLDKWHAFLSLSALEQLCASDKQKNVFEIRFRSQTCGFEWREACLTVLANAEGNPERILLTAQHVNHRKQTEIIQRAVESEYDCVVYIESRHNSYILYTSERKSDTPLPPTISDNYELSVAEFHRQYVPEDQHAQLTQKFSIAHVDAILKKYGEYTLFCNIIEDGVVHEKKMRFSYYDKAQDIWLLTRTDITEIREEKRQKQLLQDALNAATAANKAKSNFLSRMSHDIRTPMNAIIGMTMIAGAHIDNQERVADCLEKITVSSKLLLGLINEVLDMSKVESGNIVLSEEPIDLADLVQGVITMIQPPLDHKKQSFEAHINQVRHENVIGDTQRLQQVLLNLLSNAVKYTPENGHILFEIVEHTPLHGNLGCYEFLVKDDGYGIQPEFLDKLFEPFERAEDDVIQAIPGTGLGMAISKNIVEMMGGTIQVQSTPGHGSTFTVTVYLKLQHQPDWSLDTMTGLPILVVDDDALICKDVCTRLNRLGMDCKAALNGHDAVRQILAAHASDKDFFAAIIDLRMPGMDGIETTRQIRAKVGYHMPIIMISAYDQSEYEDAAIAAGVNGFIIKPLFQSRLIYKLKQLVLHEPIPNTSHCSALTQCNYTGKYILIVEDNVLNLEIAQELVSSTGATVETAENGKVAVERFCSCPTGHYSLIFMDMQMPIMDGCEATQKIRALEREDAKTVPIVAMTANAFTEDIQRTQQAGMNGHLSKPIDMEQFSQTLKRWLGNGLS